MMFFAGFVATLVAINTISSTSSSDLPPGVPSGTSIGSDDITSYYLTRFPDEIGTTREIRTTKAAENDLTTFPETRTTSVMSELASTPPSESKVSESPSS